MKLAIGILILGVTGNAIGQTRYIDRGGKATFFSSAPIEDIKAETGQAVSILDVKTGEIVASLPMRSFKFRKALMQEHFNENYVESDKYPNATFKGIVTNLGEFDITKNGKYTLNVNGEMKIHGVTKPLNVKAEALVDNGTIKANTVFPIIVKDFDIEIPRLVIMNIAEEVEVTVSFNYKKMKPD